MGNEQQDRQQWKPAPYNPRTIGRDALMGLERSLRVFGDLSGIVLNDRTGHIVCGHQRHRALPDLDFGAVAWGEEVAVELGEPHARFESMERRGEVRLPGGGVFAVRRVDWPESFEKAANVVANDPHIQGEFDKRVNEVLASIREQDPGLFEDVGLSRLEVEKLKEAAQECPISPELFERHDYLVFYFDNELDWKAATEAFEVGPVKESPVYGKTLSRKRGTGRVLPGSELVRRVC